MSRLTASGRKAAEFGQEVGLTVCGPLRARPFHVRHAPPEMIERKGVSVPYENQVGRTVYPAPAVNLGIHFRFYPQHHPLGRRWRQDRNH